MKRDYALTKSERVCKRAECTQLFSSTDSVFSFPVKALYVKRDHKEGAKLRVLVSVGKRYNKRAVKRNIIRRRLREAFRLNKHLFFENLDNEQIAALQQTDICLIYISKSEESYLTIEDGVKKIITSISLKKSNNIVTDSIS